MQGRDKAYAHKNVVVEFLFFVVHDKKKKERNHVPRSLWYLDVRVQIPITKIFSYPSWTNFGKSDFEWKFIDRILRKVYQDLPNSPDIHIYTPFTRESV